MRAALYALEDKRMQSSCIETLSVVSQGCRGGIVD